MKNLFESENEIISNIGLDIDEYDVISEMVCVTGKDGVLFINVEPYNLSVMLISIEKDELTHSYFSCHQDFYSLEDLKEGLCQFEKIPWQSSGESIDVYSDIMLGLHDVQNTGLIDLVKNYIIEG